MSGGGRAGGPLPLFPKHFPHYANDTSAHRTGGGCEGGRCGTGECGTLGKSELPEQTPEHK